MVDGVTVACALAAGAAVAVVAGPAPARARLAAVRPAGGRAAYPGRVTAPTRRATGSGRVIHVRSGPGAVLSSSGARLVAGALGGLGSAVVLGGTPGLVAGCLVAGLLVRWLGRLEPGSAARETAEVEAALPLVADLLSAVVAAGTPPDRAAHLVGSAVGGPLGALLVAGADRTSLGGDPATAWRGLTARPVTTRLARALVAAGERGAAPAEALARVAADARNSARWAAETRVRALGARAAAPLGLCFLPAFLLVGVVPVVAGAGSVLP